LKPTLPNNLRDSILKKHITKNRAGGVAQGVGSEFKPQFHKKPKQNTNVIGRQGTCPTLSSAEQLEKHVSPRVVTTDTCSRENAWFKSGGALRAGFLEEAGWK
jgi:translation initiation factor 2 gamma subunit (eIF-2gamma)